MSEPCKHEPAEMRPPLPERGHLGLTLSAEPAMYHIIESPAGKACVCKHCSLLYWVWENKP